MTVGVKRHNAVVIIRMALIIGDIAGVIQIRIQHLIAAGDIHYAAVRQHHTVRVNLAQPQGQFRTVIHGDSVGIQLRGFFCQRGQATAVQIKAVGGDRPAVTDIQRRAVGQGDAVSEKT
ncbi:hypothetical protein D3C80_1201510 [compost metagenome]